jgi:hypothetical protein
MILALIFYFIDYLQLVLIRFNFKKRDYQKKLKTQRFLKPLGFIFNNLQTNILKVNFF